ncbi:hypothetical protein GCM10012275_64500 [Longimycelium tulufanense]|uniref:Uncharacterized protein n=1 Tax=Longimycelium tulufanense TaxID=907463 RepID=A0A8J3CJ49_9PSEU|nr:hypothetical protein [Longimycelium tulufanense]GGM84851.1 hypothetical protein GCM10012275_64500 [Longimycelium tulufanense]
MAAVRIKVRKRPGYRAWDWDCTAEPCPYGCGQGWDAGHAGDQGRRHLAEIHQGRP